MAELAKQVRQLSSLETWMDRILDAAGRDPAGFTAIVKKYRPDYNPYEGE